MIVNAIDSPAPFVRQISGTVYRNTLPRDCPGLARDRGFSYSARGDRLCGIDLVTVVGPASPRPCPLGAFLPITREEALQLQRDPGALDPVDRSVEAEQVELPPEDTPDDC